VTLLASVKDNTVNMLLICVHVPVYTFHKQHRIFVSFLKSKLALDICNTPAPGKVSIILEFNSLQHRKLYWKRKKGKPMGVAQDVLLTTWFCL
jgi:hypothetical protein